MCLCRAEKVKAETISVIVPAYRVGHFLTRSVNSILCQTYPAIEIWIVDDGSDEGTGEIADVLARADSRVHVLHQRNKRGYLARLMGLRRIHSSWFGFVDADDFIESTMYERLHTFAVQNKLEIAQCDSCHGVYMEPELFLTREQVFKEYVWPRLFCGQGAVFVWDKLYKNTYDFSRFAEMSVLMFDDMILNLYLFEKVTRLGLLHEGLYHYLPNAQSSVRNYKRQNMVDFLSVIRFRREMVMRYGVMSSEMMWNMWIIRNTRNLILSAMRAPLAMGENRIQNIRDLYRICSSQLIGRYVGNKDIWESYWIIRLAWSFPRSMCLFFAFICFIRNCFSNVQKRLSYMPCKVKEDL